MSSLGIDWMRLIWQAINFLILLYLLNRLLFKPVLKLMDARALRVRESMEAADRARAEVQETEQANRSALDDARKQASEMLAAATETANQIREQAGAQAREDAERLLERARNEIALERDQAVALLRKQAVDLAIAAAGRVIDRSLTGPEHYRIVEQFMDDAQGSPN